MDTSPAGLPKPSVISSCSSEILVQGNKGCCGCLSVCRRNFHMKGGEGETCANSPGRVWAGPVARIHMGKKKNFDPTALMLSSHSSTLDVVSGQHSSTDLLQEPVRELPVNTGDRLKRSVLHRAVPYRALWLPLCRLQEDYTTKARLAIAEAT